jgi:hypothetical protein
MPNIFTHLNVTLYESLFHSNATNGTHLDQSIGYLSMLVASVLWGVNNLPVKHYEMGDGKCTAFQILYTLLLILVV